MGTQRWEVMSLDVWGNEKDGYEVNNWFHAGWLEFDDYPSENDIFKALKSEGLIGDKVRRAAVYIDPASSDGYYEVADNRKTKGSWMQPIYQVYWRNQFEGSGGGKRRHATGSLAVGSVHHVDCPFRDDGRDIRLVDDVEILEAPTGRGKVLVYSPQLRANILLAQGVFGRHGGGKRRHGVGGSAAELRRLMRK